MNNGSSSLPKLKIQNMQRKREIDKMLERDISGIVNKKRNSGLNNIKSEINENIASRLRSFLDERLSNGFDKKSHVQKSNLNDRNYYEEDDEDYYDDREDDYDDYEDDGYERREDDRQNPNSYLPFAYEDFKPEVPADEELEEMILGAVMPSIAQWLDLNIDRIVHKVVKESLQNRGMPEGEPSYSSVRRYSENISEADENSNYFNRESHFRRNPRDYNDEEEEILSGRRLRKANIGMGARITKKNKRKSFNRTYYR
ncbi:MAG: hypothetical protein FWE18_03945 [Alphaproteobacteria bacterium]|nr:hypothetical protein [Alphaproteobacteria bacterium]